MDIRKKQKRKCLFLDYVLSCGAAKNRLELTIQGFKHNDIEVNYLYIHKGSYRPILQIIRQLFLYLCFLVKMRKNDMLYIYGDIHIPFLVTIAKFKKIIVLHERTEYPVNYLFPENKNIKTDFLFFLYQQTLKKVDVFITCSHVLDSYYRKYLAKNVKSVIIPFMVDLSKFILTTGNNQENIITYCGYMGEGKDNVKDLIQIFCSCDYVYNNYRLVLIGDAIKEEFDKLKLFARQIDKENRVEFTGRLEHEEVINILMKSSIHILVRNNIDRNNGGIPSKVAEYLATSKPAIVSDVGELSLYLQDSENIFFVQSGDNQLFISKLFNIIKQNELLQRVGKKGRRFVEDYTPQKQVSYALKVIDNES